MVLVGVLSIVSLSVFWFDDELLLLPEFVIVGLVVKMTVMRVMILILMLMVRAKVMIMMINLLLLVMVEEMVVLRPPYVPF